MNIATMRLLDRWAGVPLCATLTLVRRVADGVGRWNSTQTKPPGPSPVPLTDGTRPPSILLVKLAEMGSTVLALPALVRLQELYPGVRLHYLCFRENRSVIDLIPEVRWEAVHTIRTDSAATVIRDSLSVLRALRRLKLDAAIDLEIFSRASAALIYASGARIRVGYHRFFAEGLNCGDLFTHRLSHNSHLHISGAFMALVEALAGPPDEVPMLKSRIEPPRGLPRFRPTPEEAEAVRDKLQAHGYPADGSGRIIILNANASDLLPLRKWAPERFEELARRCLAADENHWIVLTGSPAEVAAIDALARRIDHPRVINMAGKTTLREVVTLYGLAEVLVTNDSGPAHFAALTPVSIVSLFGPETPNLYRPLSEANHSITAGLACSPCIHVFNSRLSACTVNRCMQAIAVDEVFAAVTDALRRRIRQRTPASTTRW